MPNRVLATGVAAWLILNPIHSNLRAEPKRDDAGAGSMSVASDPPDAAVYVDGQLAGRTPVKLERVQAGDHRVRVVKDGYLENGRIVTVGAGKTADLQLRLTPSAGSNGAAGDQTGGGISSGPPTSNRKWWYLGAAGGGAAATAIVLATRNRPPTIGTLSATPPTGLLAATPIAFAASSANDPDGDPLTYSWEFGDGMTSKEQMPRHVYNAAGPFMVKCTISDGKHSDTGTTSVTVRSLAGTWRGPLDNGPPVGIVQETIVMTQSGATISGTFVDVFGSGVISGFVATSSPLVRFTIQQPGFNPFTFTADPNGEVTTLTGAVNGSGFINAPFTVTRQ